MKEQKTPASSDASISSEQKDYLKQLERANLLVARVLAQTNRFERHDLFHIALSLQISAEERLARGLRRRRIGHAS